MSKDMSIKDRLDIIEDELASARTVRNGDAAVRIFTIHKDVMMYLIAKGQVSMSDSESVFQEYIDTYTIPALYRVAEYYRKQMGLPALNYKQSAYHDPQSVHRNPQEQM